MHFSTIAVGTLAALATSASAAKVTVQNNCKFPVYYQAVPNNNAGPPGPIKKMKPGDKISSAYQLPSGAAVKLTNSPSGFATPLTMEYTPSNGLVYYDLSDNSGNPFAAYSNYLLASNDACYDFKCAANDPGCYSSGAAPMVKACQTTTLKTILCA